MDRDAAAGQSLQEFLSEYFPNDAVQVLEEVRGSRTEINKIDKAEADLLLGSLSASMSRLA
jgi:hypothetical protein